MHEGKDLSIVNNMSKSIRGFALLSWVYKYINKKINDGIV